MGLTNLRKKARWSVKGHVFSSPFYYIDYTLAQVVAFQYWIKDRENHEKAWSNYVSLCKLGDHIVLVYLKVGLENPFVDGKIKRVAKPLKAYLDSVDDTKF